MVNVVDEVARLTGSRPKREAAELLTDWLLPAEQVVAGVYGTTNLMPTWFLATPTTLLILRHGMQAEIRAGLLGNITGYEVQPGWSSSKLILGTTYGNQSLAQVNREAATQFVYILERLLSELLMPGSLPRSLAALDSALADLIGAVESAGDDPQVRNKLGNRSAEELATQTVLFLLIQAVKRTEVLTTDRAEALLVLAFASGIQLTPGRGSLVRALIEGSEALPAAALVDVHERVDRSSGELERAIQLLAEVVLRFGELVPQSSPPEARREYRDLAQRLGGTSPQAQTAKPTTAPPSDEVLARLERLASMRDNGVLSQDEFDRLKASIIAGLT